MQKVQIGGGTISPIVAAHVHKSAMQLKSQLTGPTSAAGSQMGGGVISPNVKKHLARSSPVMGGGAISPQVAKHLQAQ
jgi:uncharacterized protein (DUF1786 family)